MNMFGYHSIGDTVRINGYGACKTKTDCVRRIVSDRRKISDTMFYKCAIGTKTTGMVYHWYPAHKVLSTKTDKLPTIAKGVIRERKHSAFVKLTKTRVRIRLTTRRDWLGYRLTPKRLKYVKGLQS